MPGSVDLTIEPWILPQLVVLDTNIVIEHLLHLVPGVAPYRLPLQTRRAEQVFTQLKDFDLTGVVTPTIFVEALHIAVRARYQAARSELGSVEEQIRVFGEPIKDALQLYKRDPAILHAFSPALEQLRLHFVARGLLIISPSELAPIESGRSYDAELVHLVGRYGLDSNDAAILMEARRCGVTEIVTFDRDLLRAQSDFTIYTWV